MSDDLTDFFDYLFDAYPSVFPDMPEGPPLTEIGKGGSNRRFFRVGVPPSSIVGMVSPDPPCDDRGISENDSFLYVARHLAVSRVPAPSIYACEPANGWFVLEDVGDTLLYDVYTNSGDTPATRDLLKEAVRNLVGIHIRASRGFMSGNTHNADYGGAFVREHESGYFQEWFLDEYADLKISRLDQELDRMAEDLDRFVTPHFLYRDFQSQNIAVKSGRLRFLDFQGARLGPRQYDLASLVFDPYLELSPSLQRELQSVYVQEYRRLDREFDLDSFSAGVPIIAAHRLMQALGAYELLSKKMGKRRFRQYIPPAVRFLARLLDTCPELDSYPCFHDVVGKLMDRIQGR